MKQIAHTSEMIGRTPEAIGRNRKMAEALIRQGTSSAPVQHWTQALARVAQAGNGALHRHFADKNEKEGLARGNEAIAQALAGGSMTDAAQALMGNPYTAQAGQGMAINAIQGRETAARQERLAQIKAQQPTAFMRNYDFARQNGFKGSPADYKRAGTASTNITMKGETKFAETRGKHIADGLTALEAKSDAARDMAQGYTQIGNLLGDQYVYTGTGAEPIAWMKKAAKTFAGIDVEGVAEATVAEKTRKGLLGKIREMAGDQRMTDADRKFYMETMPGLSDDAEGVALMVELTNQMAKATHQREAKAAEFIQAAPNAQMGWRGYRSWSRKQPIWDPALMARAREVAKRAKQSPPTAGTRLRWNPEKGIAE